MMLFLYDYNICIPMYCIWGYAFNLYLKRKVYVFDILAIFVVSFLFIKQFNFFISLSSGVWTFLLCFYRDRYILFLHKVFKKNAL